MRGGCWGLQEAGFPSINLICEKVSFEGVTRFEDKYRLPMGISVNQSGRCRATLPGIEA